MWPDALRRMVDFFPVCAKRLICYTKRRCEDRRLSLSFAAIASKPLSRVPWTKHGGFAYPGAIIPGFR